MSLKCIKNGTILTMNSNNTIIENGYVIIKDNEIIEIGQDYTNSDKEIEIIDADGGIIMPGFVNAHCHVSMNVFKSLGDDIPNRLTTYMLPMEDELVDRNLVYIGAKVGIYEMLLSGVTTFADMYYYEDEVAKACEELGIRCIAGETIINKPSPDSTTPYGGLDYFNDFYEKYRDSELITPALAPHATYTVDAEHLQKIKAISDKLNVPMLIHIAEVIPEMELFRDKYNTTPIKYLDSLGILSDKLVGAHLVYVDDEDIEIINKSKMGVAHCVSGNSKGGRKLSPAPKMREKGVKIAFGTDGAMSGNHLDVLNLLGTYTRMHKSYNENVQMCPSIEAVRISTIEGADCLGMSDKIGSIEIGKKADIIIVETKSPNIAPVFDYYSALTYAAYPSNVVMTMVNGKIVMKDRKIMADDFDNVMKEFSKITTRIRDKAKELEARARDINK